MKTTLEIPDGIFRRAKSVAAERGIPLRALISEALADKLRADNGSDNFISGAPDQRWNSDTLRQLMRVKTRDLEVVEMKGMVIDRRR